MKTGIELIKAERARQVSKENYDADHDDQHSHQELAMAARSYVSHYTDRAGSDIYVNQDPPSWWPWDNSFWNPKDPIRDLTRAGALIAAEIDRLLRIEARRPPAWTTEMPNQEGRYWLRFENPKAQPPTMVYIADGYAWTYPRTSSTTPLDLHALRTAHGELFWIPIVPPPYE